MTQVLSVLALRCVPALGAEMTVSRYVEISGDDVASQLGLAVSDMKAELALRGCRAFSRASWFDTTLLRFTSRCSARRTMTMSASVSAEIVTVYQALDGGIHHARCGQRVALHGQRAEELDFYCLTCAESVTLPVCVLSRIPVAGEPTECAA